MDASVHKAAIAKEWNKSQQPDREEQAFYEGLNPKVRLELTRMRIKDVEDSIKYISEFETKLLNEQRYQINKIPFNNNSSVSGTRNQTTKWCKFHRSTSHNTVECFKKRKIQKNPNVGKRNQTID